MKILICFVFIIFISAFSNAQDETKAGLRTEEISIEAGKFLIKGDLVMPQQGSNFPVVIFCTGSGPTNRKQTIGKSKIIRTFIENGYAFFIDDKPGSGDSKGEFSGDSLLRERAFILSKEVESIKKHPLINPGRIGLYGSSQASYVMSIYLENPHNISFVIAWSCPAMNSIEQSAYLVKNQALCGGSIEEEAEKLHNFFIQRSTAKSYKEYREAAEFVDSHPVIKELGWGGVMEESDFIPLSENSESYINPVDGLGKIKIPALFIFAEKDTQIDPVQGAKAFEESLYESGNQNFKIVTIPGADHNMRLTKTGCMKEQKEMYSKEGGSILAPEFLETIFNWLKI
jgi:uncharacterized protein